MERIDIHISPQNFPQTNAKIEALMDTITKETISLVKTQTLPPQAALSIALGVLFMAKSRIEAQMDEIKSHSPNNAEIVHAYKNDDGTIRPFATGAQMTPLPNPHINN